MADPVADWQRRLAERIGMTGAERSRLLDGLTAFCSRHGTDPVALLAGWAGYPELTVRRRGGGGAANLAVESFLIHNGVNVFGDIVCVAGRAEDLAAQGAQFVPEQA
jgi:hypothetical protein